MVVKQISKQPMRLFHEVRKHTWESEALLPTGTGMRHPPVNTRSCPSPQPSHKHAFLPISDHSLHRPGRFGRSEDGIMEAKQVRDSLGGCELFPRRFKVGYSQSMRH
jgi:hypothetical protein